MHTPGSTSSKGPMLTLTEHRDYYLILDLITVCEKYVKKARDDEERQSWLQTIGSLTDLRFNHNGNSTSVTYDFSEKSVCTGVGRLMASTGVQKMKRTVRNAYVGRLVWDIDSANCAPTILLSICQQEGWPCRCLTKYIDQRDKILERTMKRYPVDRATAKTAFLVPINCGNPDQELGPLINGTFIQLYHSEVKLLIKRLVCKHPAILSAVKLAGKSNPMGSAVSIILQDKERQVTHALMESLTQQGRVVRTLIYDGLHIDRKPGEKEVPKLVLHRAEQYVLEKTGIAMKFEMKPMPVDAAFQRRLSATTRCRLAKSAKINREWSVWRFRDVEAE